MTASIVAAVFDTYPTNQFLKLATSMVEKCSFVEEIFIFGTEPISNHSFIRIERIKNIQDYNYQVLVNLHKHIPDKHVLIYQWDGFPLNPDVWSDEFLNFDYLGAPHKSDKYHCEFFNGGFSLRSPQLNKKVHDLILQYPELINHPEDAIICHLLREKLEFSNCNFPNTAIASRFAFEHEQMLNTFGFHGVFNLPSLINEEILIQCIPELIEKVSNTDILSYFLFHGYSLNQELLLRNCVSRAHEWGAMNAILERIRKNTPNSDFSKMLLSMDPY